MSAAVLAALVLGYCVASSAPGPLPDSVGTDDAADRETDASFGGVVAGESVARTPVEREAPESVAGPASPDVVRQIEMQLRQSLDSCREIAARASERRARTIPFVCTALSGCQGPDEWCHRVCHFRNGVRSSRRDVAE
jgi:hypothetical protein